MKQIYNAAKIIEGKMTVTEKKLKITATCSSGLEEVLQNEIKNYGGNIENTGKNMVQFYADTHLLYKLNMASRTATHFLLFLKQFFFKNADDFYSKMKQIAWETYFTVHKLIRIDTKGTSSEFRNTHFATLRAKDAIADRFRDICGNRISVCKDNPEIQITVYLKDNQAIVYLDSSGVPLFKRGYRSVHAQAPLKEDLAAGILILSGWDKKCNLVDPMCGSGTFLFEGYLMANNIAPNLNRNFAFMHWKNYDNRIHDTARRELETQIVPAKTQFIGYDIHESPIKLANSIKDNYFPDSGIHIIHNDFRRINDNISKSFIIANPPYGERMQPDNSINDFYHEIGDFLKQKCSPGKACILTGNLEAAKNIGLRTSRKIKLYNGSIECRLLTFEIYEGTRKNKTPITN